MSNLTGITNSMLTGKKSFSDVFAEFLQWIDATVNEFTPSNDVRVIPGETMSFHYDILILQAVLVAYNGFRFDYPITLAEIQRNSLSFEAITSRSIHFADTYDLLQRAQSSGSYPTLSDMPLNMESLIDAFVPSHNYSVLCML